MIKIELNNTVMEFSSEHELDTFLKQKNLSVDSSGNIYELSGKGIIPEILDKWFAARVEYKNLMKKYADDGDKEKELYYDKRQHVQKIFLNSIYGVLGLPIFRFYDLDNALAVTATGQDVIKTSAKFVNAQYRKLLGSTQKNYCIYIDTDSLYFQAAPFMKSTDDPCEVTIKTARKFESDLNSFYKIMAQRLFFCDSPRFVIKGESVAKTAFWVAKKRYALLKVYDLEKNKITDSLTIKGLDVVRSSFPPAFARFMKITLMSILNKATKETIDTSILTFVENLSTMEYLQVARNTSVKNMSQYDTDASNMTSFAKGTPMHVKAALVYNRLLTYYGLQDQYAGITDGSKIKYVRLKDNPFHIECVALKGYDDPKQILDLITTYVDHQGMFDAELKHKIEDFYSAMKWGKIPTEVNQFAVNFFEF